MNERYSPEKAREEATRMSEKIETGKAKDYPEAEKQVDLEEGELAPVLVSVEQLIPGIKPKQKDSSISIEKEFNERYSDPQNYTGNYWPSSFTEKIQTSIYWAFADNEYNTPKFDSDINSFNGQIVVDLGAGRTPYAYLGALYGKAKGYVAVDKFQYRALQELYGDTENLRQEAADSVYTKRMDLIPVAIEDDDMLSFLRRLPDNSVSIICCGMDDIVLPNYPYRKEVEKEMARVLNQKGLIIQDDGSLRPSDDDVEKRYSHRYFNFLVKKANKEVVPDTKVKTIKKRKR